MARFVSDLVSLIARVPASMDLIESAIPGAKSLGHQEIGGDVVVPDELTLPVARARLRH